jgi:tetratricopeptide (TPR) repeat protein
MFQRLYSGNRDEIAMTLNLIGIGYFNSADSKQAIKYYLESLQMFQELYSENHQQVAKLLNNIGYYYYTIGNYVKAAKYAKESINMHRALYNNNYPPEVTGVMHTMGAILIQTGDTEQALDYLQQGLTIITKFKTDGSRNDAYIYYAMGILYFKNHEYQKAMEYATKSLYLRKKLYREVVNNHELIESLKSVAAIRIALRERNLALKLHIMSFGHIYHINYFLYYFFVHVLACVTGDTLKKSTLNLDNLNNFHPLFLF